VNVIIYCVLAILGIMLFLFVLLLVLRLVGSRRERKLLEKKEHLNPMLFELLTEDRGADEIASILKSVVPRSYYAALELVMLENMRFVKGSERDVLSRAFEELGYVDKEIHNLRRRGMARKAEAAFHLGSMRAERATPDLARELSSPRPQVSFSCLNALSKIGTPEALGTVVAYLASSEELETLRVAEVILERKQEFTDYLKRWLEQGEPDRSRLLLLINILGAMKDAQTVSLLLHFLGHEDDEVRARAAFALGNTGDFVVCEALVDALDDESTDVRAETAEALGKLQCEIAIPRLKEGLFDPDLAVKMNCAVALSKLGGEGRAVLEESLLAIEETSRGVTAEVLETLGVREKDRNEGE